MPAHERWDRPVSRLVRAFAEGFEPDTQDFTDVQRVLKGRLRARFSALSDAETDEVVSDALTRTLTAARSGRLRHDEQPARYVWTIASHAGIDALRRKRPVESLPDEVEPAVTKRAQNPQDDDELARLLDVVQSKDEVVRALRLAASRDDHQCTRVVATWLRLAERTGEAPSARAVALVAELTHPTVRVALERFANYAREARRDR